MTDERQGLPSASGMDRIAHCPASRQLEPQAPEAPKDEAEETVKLTGTVIHAALEKHDFDALEMTLRDIAEAIENLENNLVEAWCRDLKLDRKSLAVIREQRFWLINERLENVLSAKPDVVFHSKEKKSALIINYKTGFKPHLAARSSYQCRTEAVCVASELELEEVRVCVAQHRFRSSATAAQYSKEHLQYATNELRLIDWRSLQPNATFAAGWWCDWCKAKSICKTAAVYALLPSTVTTPDLPNISNDDAAFIERRRGVSEKVFAAVKERLKTLPEDELQRLGFELWQPKDALKIKSVFTLIKVLRDAGLVVDSDDETSFIDAALPNISFPKVDEWVGKKLAKSIGRVKRNDAIKGVAEKILKPLVVTVPQSKRLSDKLEKA